MLPKFFIITTVSDSLPFFKGQLNVLKKIFNISLVSSPGIHLEKMTKDYNVDAFPIVMSREISIFRDLKSLWKLHTLFRKEKPKIVHGNTPKASLLSMMAAWLARVPIRIYYVHGLRYQSVIGGKKKLLILMEKLSCYFATDVIAVSKGIQEQLKSDNITSKEIQLIWNGSINGIDTEFFNPDIVERAKIDRIGKDDFVFGFVGRLVKDKGIEELVWAFLKLLETDRNIKLLILGNFEEDPTLSTEVMDNIQNHPNIVYVGPQKDVRPFLKAMNIFVLPSYREGFGIVLMEAAAMEIVSITSDISGCNEVVIDNKTGFLVESRNVESLFTVMQKVFNNKDVYKKMSAAARESVLMRYEQQKVWEFTLDMYQQIMIKNNV